MYTYIYIYMYILAPAQTHVFLRKGNPKQRSLSDSGLFPEVPGVFNRMPYVYHITWDSWGNLDHNRKNCEDFSNFSCISGRCL